MYKLQLRHGSWVDVRGAWRRGGTRAVREYLEAIDEEALAGTLPKRLSLTDPQARWTAAPVVQRMASLQERAFARHESQHHHLPIPAVRLRNVSDENQVLPEHFDSQDCPQRP